jgi:hypothetical protein
MNGAAEPRATCVCGDSVRRSMVPAHVATSHKRHIKRITKRDTDEVCLQLDALDLVLVFFEESKEWLMVSMLPFERAWLVIVWASIDCMLKVDNATSLIFLPTCAQTIITQTNDDSLFLRLRLFRAADYLHR